MTVTTLKLLTKYLEVIPFQADFSCAVRIAFKKWEIGWDLSKIREFIKSLPRFKNTPKPIIDNAVDKAKAIYKSHKTKVNKAKAEGKPIPKMVFGGKDNLLKRTKGQITGAEWKDCRLQPIVIVGETNRKSNRYFDFSQIDQGIIIYKPNKHTHIPIQIKVSKKQDKIINYLKNNIGIIPITVTLKKTAFVCHLNKKNNRYMKRKRIGLLGLI